MRGGIRKGLRAVETAPAVDAVEIVRCKECVHRGNSIACPMCFEETYYDEDDGGDWYTVDHTTDDGFCHCRSKETYDDEN